MAAVSSVVELCTLADASLDAATSAKLFRDDDGSGGAISSFSWPEAGRTPSKLSDQSTVQELCRKYKVPADYTPLCIDGRWVACQTPPDAESSNAIFVYADALEAGMRIPLHDFYVEVLGHYGLAPSQLAPDAWCYLAAFVLLSKDAGVEPSLPAFRSFFSICTHEGDSMGWHHFRSRPGSCCLFRDKVPRSPDPEWKSRFFLLRSPSTRPWPCPVKWGKPSRAAVRMPVVTADTDMVMKKLLDRAGSVMQFLSRRSPPVAPPPPPQEQQEDKLVKVGAAAAAPGPAPPPPPPQEPPPPPLEPTRKRKSFCGTHTRGRGLVDCIAEASEFFAEGSESFAQASASFAQASELAMEAMTELDATKAEVAQLKEALSVANANRKARTAHAEVVKAECASVVAKLQVEHDAAVAQLKEEQAASFSRLKEEHAAEVGRLADEHRKEAERAAEHHKAEVAKHAAAVARLEEDHATSVDLLKEEHAADVARVKDAAHKELQDTKKKIVLRLFPELDVSLLERPKLPSAGAGTPKAEDRS